MGSSACGRGTLPGFAHCDSDDVRATTIASRRLRKRMP